MQKVVILNYFTVGYNYHILRFQTQGKFIRGENSVSEALNGFFALLVDLDLEVTMKAAGDLRDIREELTSLPDDAVVDEQLAERIKVACKQFDKTLDAELELRTAFLVTAKRYPLENLMSSPGKLFGCKVFENLPPICKFDFTNAGLCIAFNLPTAAAFHTMRGVEGVLRFYYEAIVKRNRVKKLFWYDMLNHLRKRKDTPPKALIDNLDNIRENFRNPTQHPDAQYDVDEAQDLLSVGIDVTNRMIKDLVRRAMAKHREK